MVLIRILLCSFTLLCIPHHGYAQWTNEPAGSSVKLDCSFSSTPAACGILDAYASSIPSSDATAPISPSGVIKSTIFAGNSSGGMQLNYYLPQGNREMYMGIMWRTNPEFQGRPNSNKLFFLRGPQANGVWIFGNSALVNGSAPLIFGHNTGGGLLDNSHACSSDLGLACFPNAGPGLLTRGVWTKIEAYVKSSTTNTSRDGIDTAVIASYDAYTGDSTTAHENQSLWALQNGGNPWTTLAAGTAEHLEPSGMTDEFITRMGLANTTASALSTSISLSRGLGEDFQNIEWNLMEKAGDISPLEGSSAGKVGKSGRLRTSGKVRL